MSFELREIQRRLENVISIGTVSAVNHQQKTLRLQLGDIQTDWLDMPAQQGRNFKRWQPIRKGQQFILGAPNGELEQAVIIGELYSDHLPSPSHDPELDLIQFECGTVIQHDNRTGKLTIQAQGEMELVAKILRIKAPVEQTGGDMTSEGISAQQHLHGGIKAGPNDTDKPK